MPLLLAQHDDIATSDRQSATGRLPHLFRISRVGCSYRLRRIAARDLEGRLIGAPDEGPLFKDDGSEHLTAPVRLQGARIERSRQFGHVYLALALWRGVGA
jgi:hypothetical protein